MNRLSYVPMALLVGWLAGSSPAHGGESIHPPADQARAEAQKWQTDARLVQIEVTGFGFATDQSGMPDLTKAGPPGLAMFNFISPSAHQALRISITLKISPEQLKFLQEHGGSAMRVERLPTPYSPFTLPIPENFIDLDQAIAQAQKNGVAAECAGANRQMSSCALVSDAELHVYWSGTGESGTPVWKISFGQNPKTLETVTREVDGASGEVLALKDMQAETLYVDKRTQQIPLSNVGRDFDSVWKVVNQAVAKQDPLYKPYAVALILYLHDSRANAGVYLSQAYIQYARITPSLYWDDMVAHVEWSPNSQASLKLTFGSRRAAPQEPFPRTMEAERLPAADVTLRKLVHDFPANYAEQYTTWERGCVKVLTVSPSIRETRCGVLVPTTHYSDEIFLWLTRQGNPYWRSEASPLASESVLIAGTAGRDRWVWWTRVKQRGQWQYRLIDAVTGAAGAECTAPLEAGSSAPPALVPCS